MIFDFSMETLNQHMKNNNVKKNIRRSILGMIRSWDLQARTDAARGLKNLGLVNIDWDYCCPCGACDPEPLVYLKQEVKLI